MPYFTVNTSLLLSIEQKKEIINFISEKTNEHLGIFLDKIQVTLQLLNRECFGKAGASLIQDDFSEESRISSKETRQSYYSKPTADEEMVVIELDIWKNDDSSGKKCLFNTITTFFKNHYLIPGDNILILVREMPPGAWIQNGVPGDDPFFLEKSRKY